MSSNVPAWAFALSALNQQLRTLRAQQVALNKRAAEVLDEIDYWCWMRDRCREGSAGISEYRRND